MELLGFLAVAVLTFVGVLRINTRPTRRRAAPLDVLPADAEELDAIAHRLLWERLTQRSTALAVRLRTILGRQIPPRGLTPAPAGSPWTLTFADGSALAVTARRHADLTDLLVCLVRGRATLLGHRFEGDDVVLEIAAGNRLVHLTAVAAA